MNLRQTSFVKTPNGRPERPLTATLSTPRMQHTIDIANHPSTTAQPGGTPNTTKQYGDPRKTPTQQRQRPSTVTLSKRPAPDHTETPPTSAPKSARGGNEGKK